MFAVIDKFSVIVLCNRTKILICYNFSVGAARLFQMTYLELANIHIPSYLARVPGISSEGWGRRGGGCLADYCSVPLKVSES